MALLSIISRRLVEDMILLISIDMSQVAAVLFIGTTKLTQGFFFIESCVRSLITI